MNAQRPPIGGAIAGLFASHACRAHRYIPQVESTRSTSRVIGSVLATVLTLGLTAGANAAQVKVTVNVENLAPTNSITFAPLRVGFNSGVFDAFNIGATAGAAIQRIAESGSDALWRPAFEAADPTAVVGSVLPGPINPGMTASAEFMVDTTQNPFFTFAAMAVPSNDFFIGNDDPMAYRLFDNGGHLLISEITLKSSAIWDAGSEVHDPLTAAFVTVGNAAAHADQNSVVALNFAEYYAFNGLPTPAGYIFDSQLTANTDVYRISFNVTPVPEPETYAMMLAGLGLIGLITRRRARTQRIG